MCFVPGREEAQDIAEYIPTGPVRKTNEDRYRGVERTTFVTSVRLVQNVAEGKNFTRCAG